MEKQAAQDYTFVIMEKMANLQQALQFDNKDDIIKGYYDLADSIIQLEDAIIQAYDISEADVDEFENRNFLQVEAQEEKEESEQ